MRVQVSVDLQISLATCIGHHRKVISMCRKLAVPRKANTSVTAASITTLRFRCFSPWRDPVMPIPILPFHKTGGGRHQFPRTSAMRSHGRQPSVPYADSSRRRSVSRFGQFSSIGVPQSLSKHFHLSWPFSQVFRSSASARHLRHILSHQHPSLLFFCEYSAGAVSSCLHLRGLHSTSTNSRSIFPDSAFVTFTAGGTRVWARLCA